MYIKLILKRSINLIAVIAILLVGCSLYKQYSPNDAPMPRIANIQAGLACSVDSNCYPATIIVGKITDSVAQKLALHASSIKDRGMLCFHSAGGSGKAMQQISTTIINHGLTTCMADYYQTHSGRLFSTITIEDNLITSGMCASACGFILMSSDTRTYVGRTPLIGVHSPSTMLDLCFCDMQLPFSVNSHESDVENLIGQIKSLEQQHNTRALFKLSLETRSESMHYLTENEIEKFRLFNKRLY